MKIFITTKMSTILFLDSKHDELTGHKANDNEIITFAHKAVTAF